MHVLLQYQSKSYYIIGQEVYYSIGRFITLSGSYYIIGRFLLHYRAVITVSAFITLSVGTLAMIPYIFQISQESCWDLDATDCIRYEESIDCRKRMSRISHICCNVSLT